MRAVQSMPTAQGLLLIFPTVLSVSPVVKKGVAAAECRVPIASFFTCHPEGVLCPKDLAAVFWCNFLWKKPEPAED